MGSGAAAKTGAAQSRLPIRRVLRGGSWNNNPHNVRAASRNRNAPDNRNNNNGFRVASTLRGANDRSCCKRFFEMRRRYSASYS
jgi:formylglycine-generating enzyme required for sulfatase activity